MIKRVFKGIVWVLTLLSMCITICGCSTNNNQGNTLETGRKINGLSPESYVETVKVLIGGIYAPTSEDDFRNVRSIFKDYSTAAVYNKFTAVATDFENEKYTSTIKWEESLFGDKRYQYDNIDRVYYEFEVIRNYKHYKIHLDLSINEAGKISDYRVY